MDPHTTSSATSDLKEILNTLSLAKSTIEFVQDSLSKLSISIMEFKQIYLDDRDPRTDEPLFGLYDLFEAPEDEAPEDEDLDDESLEAISDKKDFRKFLTEADQENDKIITSSSCFIKLCISTIEKVNLCLDILNKEKLEGYPITELRKKQLIKLSLESSVERISRMKEIITLSYKINLDENLDLKEKTIDCSKSTLELVMKDCKSSIEQVSDIENSSKEGFIELLNKTCEICSLAMKNYSLDSKNVEFYDVEFYERILNNIKMALELLNKPNNP